MTRSTLRLRLRLSLAGLLLACGCGSFTSIDVEEDGRYVLTGWQTPGPVGFVWVCEYDEATRTLTVVESQRP